MDILRSATAPPAIYYPETDGKPVGETDHHMSALFYLRQALRYFLREQATTYVAADMLFYYEEGNPAVFKVPDVFVVKGVARHDRRIYKLWEEGVAPCVVFEITSLSTRREDMVSKRALYEQLGVLEYYMFDPLDEYLRPRFQGFRLQGGSYHPMQMLPDGALFSDELEAILRPDGTLLRVVDPHNGTAVPTLDEAVDLMARALRRAEEEDRRAEVAAQRAEVAAQRAEVEAHRAEVEAHRAEVEAHRAEVEAHRAEVEAHRAEVEAHRAEEAEAKITQLQAELAQLRRQLPPD